MVQLRRAHWRSGSVVGRLAAASGSRRSARRGCRRSRRSIRWRRRGAGCISSRTAMPPPGGWTVGLELDYASTIEYNEREIAEYILDSELLRLNLAAAARLGPQELRAGGRGRARGVRRLHGRVSRLVSRRAGDPARGARAAAAERVSLPGRSARRGRRSSGARATSSSATCAWGSAGGTRRWRRAWSPSRCRRRRGPRLRPGVVSANLLHTVRAPVSRRIAVRRQLGIGLYPGHGRLRRFQREVFGGGELGAPESDVGAAGAVRQPVLPLAVLPRDGAPGARPVRSGAGFRLAAGDVRRVGVAARAHGGPEAERAGGRSGRQAWRGASNRNCSMCWSRNSFAAGLAKIEAVVVDELLLEPEPLAPADAADLLEGPAAQVVLERLERHRRAVLAAADAMDGRHAGKIRGVRKCDPVHRTPGAGC